MNYDTVLESLEMLGFTEREALVIITVMRYKRIRTSDIAKVLGFSYTPKVHPFLIKPQKRGYIREIGRIQNYWPNSFWPNGRGLKEIVFSLNSGEKYIIERIIMEMEEKNQKVKKAINDLVNYIGEKNE